MKVAVGSDHRGYNSKEQIKAIIQQLGHECIDVGTFDNTPVDYPDIAYLAATEVSKGNAQRAILACGTGIGMSITANKIKGVRAALCHDELTAQISRHHNDANVLCVSGDLTGEVLLRKIVEVWLETDFSGGRHQRRVDKITVVEQGGDPRELKSNTSQ
ncbi:MAG TPA: ribose 5-phosphate isomerase B [Sedimentisphaerales bacterium]|nr:ribose 5-phosphate isomerase B [Sedimentisphaerales bacterium]